MAINISIPEAANQFVELLDRVKQGEEVTILEAGVVIARLVPAPKQRSSRIPGQDQGKVLIAPDFNAPLPEDVIDDFR
ncbi:MAG: type II toxin-antitoxin system Phd/YefM family antitoxin [Chroococcidiopsidaceae cyanobacterium CP_BM_RX_35]|nr:type II toxin-antitoxin system Phd/YefM family antitoxin [Chroococcidiopsidaceae cyanobacterium CP_BM_RX_35]